jgi:hypothetical protein
MNYGTRFGVFLQVCLAAYNFGSWQNSAQAGMFILCAGFALAEIGVYVAKTVKSV